ncbi:MAG TPA: hypothetical protein ENM98_05515 [Halothiobacillaceae bacterium]|mgnify:CR=1 FL=1|nr:hypothetical protein [Halothiobacillaceae bacterium]
MTEDKAARLADAKALVKAIEQDDIQGEEALIEKLTANQTASVFNEVGRITREVHDTLMNFACDERLSSLAEEEMPDARDRLRYVITLSEQAANRTLNVIDEATPMAKKITDRSRRLKDELAKITQAERENPRLLSVTKTMDRYLDSTIKTGEQVKKQLTEIMMAQEFQDLSGQLLMRVIELLEQIEDKLINLLKITAPVRQKGSKTEPQQPNLDRGIGPQGYSKEKKKDVMESQDDVDDLLDSLGF